MEAERASRQQVLAEGAAERASKQQARAERAEALARRYIYAANMSLAQHAWNDTRVGRMIQLLEANKPRNGDEDLRGFEWHYLWHLCHGELLTLRANNGSVWCVSFSPDGQRLVTAGDDDTVREWEAATGRELLTIRHPHTRRNSNVVFSPDSQRIAGIWDDQTVHVWDTASGQSLSSIRGHSMHINAVAFSPDGQRVASASDDNTVKVWDLASQSELVTVKGHGHYVASPIFRTPVFSLRMGLPDWSARIIRSPAASAFR